MYIKKIVSQYRRDFTAIFKCELCNYENTRGGYDDNYFHTNVIPTITCERCGEHSKDKVPYMSHQPKYSEGYQI